MVAETPHTVVEGGMKSSHSIDFQTTYRRRPVLHAIWSRDVSTGATVVAPKFSDNLILSPPGGRADSAHHRRGCN